MGKLEKNSAKQKKILALELNDEEWKRVGLFCDLLSVSYFLNALYDIYDSFSMPTLLNKHSQLIDLPLSMMPFRQLKLCMRRGISDLLKISILLLKMHWALRLPSSSNITRKLLLLMPMLWQWVHKIKCLTFCYLSIFIFSFTSGEEASAFSKVLEEGRDGRGYQINTTEGQTILLRLSTLLILLLVLREV